MLVELEITEEHTEGHYVRIDTNPSVPIVSDNVNLDTRGFSGALRRARLFFSLAIGCNL